MNDVTRILSAIERGEPQAAAQLLPLVYDELRQLAARKLAHEAPGQTLQAWVQNQGEGLPYAQGHPVTVHLPMDALRVLVDTGAPAPDLEDASTA